jgi:hypothetical protein
MTRVADEGAGPRSGARRSSRIADAVLVVTSVLVSIVVAEGVVRYLNGQPLLVFPLPEVVDTAPIKAGQLEQIPLAAGVDRAWFFNDPAPVPNRAKPPEGWQEQFHYYETHPSGDTEFRPTDNFKVWNSAFVGDPCKHRFLRHAPGKLWIYDPPDGVPSPPYRFYPNVTLPDGLVTNQIGWRGAPIEVPRRPKTVRIVFVGASTTVDAHHLPFSYPEFFGHWLNMWAAAKHLDVHFEVLNSGRESIVSTDIANVVRSEALPLRPDLVVYYEGGNQFRPETIVEQVPTGKPVRPPTQAVKSPEWLRTLARYSALMGRVQAAIGLAASDMDGREWPKPDYKVAWPAGLDEQDPDLAYPDLPANLTSIQREFDKIRSDLASVGKGELALSSFMWMVKDGMVLDPVRHKYILEQLNAGYYPVHYREIERLSKFQDRLLAKYAKVHGLPFVDFVRFMPFDPDLFVDAVHPTYSGIRLQAWIAFNELLPTIEKNLKDGLWPAPQRPDLPLPTFTPRQITFSCGKSP